MRGVNRRERDPFFIPQARSIILLRPGKSSPMAFARHIAIKFSQDSLPTSSVNTHATWTGGTFLADRHFSHGKRRQIALKRRRTQEGTACRQGSQRWPIHSTHPPSRSTHYAARITYLVLHVKWWEGFWKGQATLSSRLNARIL